VTSHKSQSSGSVLRVVEPAEVRPLRTRPTMAGNSIPHTHDGPIFNEQAWLGRIVQWPVPPDFDGRGETVCQSLSGMVNHRESLPTPRYIQGFNRPACCS